MHGRTSTFVLPVMSGDRISLNHASKPNHTYIGNMKIVSMSADFSLKKLSEIIYNTEVCLYVL